MSQAFKPLRYTHHAEIAIRERELQPEWIEVTARHPEWHMPDEQQPDVERRFRAIPENDGRVLRVARLENTK